MMWESLLAQAHANREQAHANRLTAEAMQKAWATLAMPQEPDQLDCWFAAGQLANDGAKLAAQLDEQSKQLTEERDALRAAAGAD